jgi:hypothetical protein
MTHRQQVEAILAGARAERAALLDQLAPHFKRWLPVDATGISQAIDHLGEAAGLDLHQEQVQAAKTNAAVLHGRVFGREQLSMDTIHAAFVDGAKARAATLAHLAGVVGADLGPLLETDGELESVYAAQEQAVLVIATHLDESAR